MIEAKHLGSTTALVHMYCQYFSGPKEGEDSPTASAIFSSFIRQLLFRSGDLQKPGSANPERVLKRAFRDGRRELSIIEATEAFLLLTANFSKIYYFVDGLDVCETKEAVDALGLFKKLLRVSKSKTVHKIFLSSEKGLEVSWRIPTTLEIEISDEAVAHDIRHYVEENVKDRIVYPQLSIIPALYQDIVEKLITGSQGMYGQASSIWDFKLIVLGFCGSVFSWMPYVTSAIQKKTYARRCNRCRKVCMKPTYGV